LLQDVAIEIEFRSTERALNDTLQLARRHKLSTYDASYLELALSESLPLATNDADLQKRWKERVAPSPEPECRSTDCASRHDHRRRPERID
jgi:predicted nucleic acid-binding protein